MVMQQYRHCVHLLCQPEYSLEDLAIDSFIGLVSYMSPQEVNVAYFPWVSVDAA